MDAIERPRVLLADDEVLVRDLVQKPGTKSSP